MRNFGRKISFRQFFLSSTQNRVQTYFITESPKKQKSAKNDAAQQKMKTLEHEKAALFCFPPTTKI